MSLTTASESHCDNDVFQFKRNLSRFAIGDVADLRITLKKTRRGQIRRIIREVYLRNDIPCGIFSCKLCNVTSPFNVLSHEQQYLLIVMKDVMLYQLDFLCNDISVQNCIFPGSVLEYVQLKNRHFYSRLRNLCSVTDSLHQSNKAKEPEQSTNFIRNFYAYPNHISRDTYSPRNDGESEEDYCDRATCILAAWYCKHLTLSFGFAENEAKKKVLVLTNSRRDAEAMVQQGVSALTVSDYVRSVTDIFPMAGECLGPVDEGEDILLERNESISYDIKIRYERHLRQDVINKNLSLGIFHKGIIQMDRNSCFCGTVHGTRFPVIRILGYKAVNRAIDGDLVVVQLIHLKEDVEAQQFLTDMEQDITDMMNLSQERTVETCASQQIESQAEMNTLDATPTVHGKVVGILRRNWKEYSGSLIPLQDREETRAAAFVKMERKFRPWDPRIPDIIINTRQSLHLDGKRIIVSIDSWDVNRRYPSGHWVQVLGKINEPDVEAQVIFNEHDVITREFTEPILRCLPPAHYVIPEEEIQRRLDLREVPTCSIDPPGCKDIDDALSCEKCPNGNYKIGVHIADVTHFVLPDTPLDYEAAQRCTTVYLVERRTDMLPSVLTTDLCSLVANADRLSFSVLWEISPNGGIISTDFKKTVIRSDKAFTYEEAQALLDDPSDTSELKCLIGRLNQLAKVLRKKRIAHGALELASLEVKFQLDSETHSPNDLDIYRVRDTNKLVEEFMLLANSEVAKCILTNLPMHSVLRRHPPPKAESLKMLKQILQERGFENFEYTTSTDLALSLNSIDIPEDPCFNKVLRVLTTRCMNQAVYVCSGDTVQPNNHKLEISSTLKDDCNLNTSRFYHYGLAAPLYTHFTSPIRRYADILVHRLLAVALKLIPLPAQLHKTDLISQQCEQMNLKHRNAQWASRSSIEFFTYRYFKMTGAAEADAIVISVRKNGVQVQVPRYGVEGIVFLDTQKFRWCGETRSLNFFCLKSQTEECLRVFDHIWIRLQADDKDLRPKTILEFLYKTPKEIYSLQYAKDLSVEDLPFFKDVKIN